MDTSYFVIDNEKDEIRDIVDCFDNETDATMLKNQLSQSNDATRYEVVTFVF